jgi:ribosomal protein S1
MSLIERWNAFVSEHPVGTVMSGRVIRHEEYGYFLDIGEPFLGLVDIINMKDQGKVRPSKDFPAFGEIVRAVILDYTERKHEVRLGTRESDFTSAISNE